MTCHEFIAIIVAAHQSPFVKQKVKEVFEKENAYKVQPNKKLPFEVEYAMLRIFLQEI